MSSQSWQKTIQAVVLVLSLLLFDRSLSAQTQYTFTKIVDKDTVGSNGQTIVVPAHNFYVSINDSGTVAFQAGNSLWTSNGSPPVLIYMGVGNGNVVGPGSILDSGEVAFVAQNSLSGSNLFLGDGGTPTLVANFSDSGGFDSRVAANNNRSISVLFFPRSVLGFSGILRFAYPELNPDTIYQCPAGFNCVSAVSPSSMNQMGDVAFTKFAEGTFQPTQVLKANTGSALATMAEAGITVEGIKFSSFHHDVSINNSGLVAFSAYGLLSPDFQNGVYVSAGVNNISKIADTQNQSPFAQVSLPVLNDNGRVAFFAELKSAFCPVGPCNGIYTGTNPMGDSVIQTGDCIKNDGVIETGVLECNGIKVLDVDNTYPPAINNSGQIVVKIRYQDANGLFQYAVYRADPANHPPVLDPIGNMSINEGSPLSFTAMATDPDPGQTLTFSLDAGAPSGASISPEGNFSWTPGEVQGPGVYPAVTVRVTDSGNPALDDAETFTITVNEVNSPPQLDNPGNKSGNTGQQLSFTLSATDPDLPTNMLSYTISSGLQAGMTLNSATGQFTWTAPTPGDYMVTFRVTDNGDPNLSDEATITIAVAGGVTGISAAERQALIDLYNSTSGASWTNKTNWLGVAGTECTWFGVSCNGLGTSVQQLTLPSNKLVGPIPVSIGNLSQLFSLNLGGNQLNGSIPASVGSLSNLTGLFFNSNQMTGPIPSELGNLARLTNLWLQSNQLGSSIPTSLANLSNLTQLLLGENQLLGPIPSELGNLAKLTALFLHFNQLSGSIPPSLGNLSNLTILLLSGNQLTGSIPPELASLSNLTQLVLNNNQLTGVIPPELGNLSKLTNLSLSSNQLSASVPGTLGSLPELTGLTLNNNQLAGPIPIELGNLSKLTALSLSFNQLSGSIPEDLGNLSNLITLSLNNNQLAGVIPSVLTNLTKLTNLSLSFNQLSGSIPTTLGNLTNLTVLRVNNNQLAGPIPTELGSLDKLQFLSLSSNQLSASIPVSLVALTQLISNQSDLRWNALYSTDGALSAFLDSKQVGGNWQSTQTIALVNVVATTQSSTSIQVSWTPIAYTGDTGRYQVLSSLTSSGPYTLAESTANKSASTLVLNNLTPATPYYFVVRTVTDPHVNNQNTVTSELSAEVPATTQTTPAAAVSLSPASLTFADTPVSSTTAAQAVTLSNTGNAALSITSITASGDFAHTNNCGTSLASSASCSINVTFTPIIAGQRTGTLTLTSNVSDSPHVVSLSGAGIIVLSSRERVALIDLYNSTSGSNWTNKTNWLGALGTECTWFGVVCSQNGDAVHQLSLPFNNLAGFIPPSIANLTQLETIGLSSNRVTGNIPAQIGSLANLLSLQLGGNLLNGSIPTELGNLAKLQTLSLAGNQLTGSIPPQISGLQALRELFLNFNQFTGDIPASLGNLSNLTNLDLFQNQLSGPIPAELGNLSKLIALRFNNNQLQGPIPAQLGNLVKLQVFLLNSNQLQGSLPASFVNLTLLQNSTGLDLRWNALYSADASLVTFLNSKQPGGDWQSTQTVAPANVLATAQSNSAVAVSWMPIPYTANNGRYEVLSSLTSNGPYTLAGSIADKFASSLVLNGLNPATPYYFVVRTVTDPHDDNQNTVTSESSAQVSATTQVAMTPTSTALTSSMNPSLFGKNVAFTARVTSPGGIPAGSVVFRDGVTVLATVALNLSGQAIYPTTALAVGSHSITASYGGNATYSPSTSSILAQIVTRLVPKITLDSSPSKPVAPAALILQTSVTSTAGSPTGTVTFKSGTTVLGTAPLNAIGVATFTTGRLAAGSYTFTATYNGDSNFEPLDSKSTKVTVK